MKMSAIMAEKCNSLSHFVDIVYNCFLIMYCIISCIMFVFNLLSAYQCINSLTEIKIYKIMLPE